MAVEKVIAEFDLDLKNLTARVREIEQQFKKVKTGADDAAKSASSSFGGIFSGLDGKIKAIGAGILAAFSVNQIIAVGKAAFKAFEEAEVSVQKLRAAVSASGGLQADFDKLIKQATLLQKTTIFNDEDIQAAQTLALQFGLTSDAVENLLPIITDFASATGQTLTDSLGSVLRALDGNARGLKVYGVEVVATQTRAEKFDSILGQLNKKFTGQAEIIAQTSAGSLKRLANSWDEVKESIGGALEPLVTGAAKLLKGLIDIGEESSLAAKLEEERIGLNALVLQLESTNEGTKIRKDLIIELNTKYPSFLANLDSEKVTNEQLSQRLKEVNAEYLRRILILSKEEQVTAQGKKTAEAYNEIYSAQREILKIATEKGLAVYVQGKKDAFEQADILIKKIGEENKAIQSGQVQTTNANVAIVKNNALIRELFALRSKANIATKEFNEENERLKDVTSELTDFQAKFGKSTDKVVEALTGLEGLTLNEFTDSLKKADSSKLIAQLKELNIELLKAQNTGDTFNINKLKERIEVVNELLEKRLEKEKTEGEKAKSAQEKLDNDLFKSTEARFKKEEEALKSFVIEKKNILDQTSLPEDDKARENAAIELFFLNASLEQRKNFFRQVEELGKSTTDQGLKNTIEALRATSDIEQKIFKETSDLNKKNRDQDLKDTLASLELSGNLSIQRLQDNFKATGDFSKKATNDLAKEIITIQKGISLAQVDEIEKVNGVTASSAAERVEIELDAADKIVKIDLDAAERRKKAILEIVDLSKQIGDALFELSTVGIDSQIADLERLKEKQDENFTAEEEALKKKLDKELITRNQFETALSKIQKKRGENEIAVNKQINDLKRKQDLAERAQAVFDITISAAVAFAEHLKESPIIAALIAALALAQLAVVLSTPLPQYAKGTLNVEGGEKGKDSVHAVLMPAESVIPVKETKDYYTTIEAIFHRKISPEVINEFVESKTKGKEKKKESKESKELYYVLDEKTNQVRGLRDKPKKDERSISIDSTHQYYKALKSIYEKDISSIDINSFVENVLSKTEKTVKVDKSYQTAIDAINERKISSLEINSFVENVLSKKDKTVAIDKKDFAVIKSASEKQETSSFIDSFFENNKRVKSKVDKETNKEEKVKKDSRILKSIKDDEYFSTIKAMYNKEISSEVLNSFVENKISEQKRKETTLNTLSKDYIKTVQSLVKDELSTDVVNKVVTLSALKDTKVNHDFAENVLSSIGFKLGKRQLKTDNTFSNIENSNNDFTDSETNVNNIARTRNQNTKKTFSEIINDNNGSFLSNVSDLKEIKNFSDIKSMLPAVNYATEQKQLVEQKIQAEMKMDYEKLENGIAEKIASKFDYIQAKYDTKKVVRVENMDEIISAITESPSDKLRRR